MNQSSAARVARASQAPVPSSARHRSPHTGALAFMAALCLVLAVFVLGLGSLFATRNPWVTDYLTAASPELVRATGLILLDEINETPHFAAATTDSSPAICPDVDEQDLPALTTAFALMRGASGGARLYDVLVQHDVCITVADIEYNGGFATSWRTHAGEWVRGSITLDDDYIRTRSADVLAAMLVHEATHIDRAIKGESCNDNLDCETLPNGVKLEEEIAAHAAEARWWIEAYGDNGKRFTSGADYGENRLAEANQDGPAAFTSYVRRLRGDPREGTGL